MAIVPVGTASNDAGSGTAISVTHSLSIQAGDVVVAVINANGSGNPVSDNNGATAFDYHHYTDNPDSARTYVFSRVAGASEPASYAFTLGASNRWSIVVRVYRGVDTSNRWAVAPGATSRATGSETTTVTAPSIDIPVAGAAGIILASDDYAPTTNNFTGIAGGYGNQRQETGQQLQSTWDKLDLSTGATGTVALTPSATVSYVVYHVALRPAAEPADPPAVTGLDPSIGSIAGGTSVTITGIDLTGATAVTFGGTAASGVTVVNDTTITCTSPAHAAGTVQVQVTTPAGSSANTAADDFTYEEPEPPAVTPSSTEPIPAVSLLIGGEEYGDLIDLESIDATRSEHGPASFTADLPLDEQYQAVSPTLTRGAVIDYRIGGAPVWDGYVARLTREGPDIPNLRIEGRGAWATLGDNEGYRKGFIETRPEKFVTPEVGNYMSARLQTGDASLDTENRVLLLVPQGSVVGNYATAEAAIWILDGLRRDSFIHRVVMDLRGQGDNWMGGARDVVIRSDLYGPGAGTVTKSIATNLSGHRQIDLTLAANERGRCLYYVMMSHSGTPTATVFDAFLESRAFRLYIDRTTEPRIDQAILEVAAEFGYAADPNSAAVGSPRFALMYDGPGTPQDAISYLATQHSLPVVVRFTDGMKLLAKPRPTAPDGTSRHWVVSRALQAGLRWGVALDDEIAKDYVAAEFDLIPTNKVPEPISLDGAWTGLWGRTGAGVYYWQEPGTGLWYLRVQAGGGGELNPIGYTFLGYVTPGARYRARAFLAMDPTPSTGGGYCHVSWRNGAGAEIGTSGVWSSTVAQAGLWIEATMTAPAGADHAYLYYYLSGYTSGTGTALFGRHFDFSLVTPSGQLQRTAYPSEPASPNARVGLLSLGSAKEAEAAAAVQQAHALWSAPYQGPVSGLAGTCHTIDGYELPVELMREGDWITRLDAPGGDAGAHYVTGVHLAGGEVDVTCGGDVAFHFEREVEAKRGTTYKGAHRIWVRTGKKKVTWLSWWRKQPRQQAYYHKHHKWPKPPKRHPKYKTVWQYGWQDVAGQFL